MFTNSTTVAESNIIANLAALAGLSPLPTATVREIADAIGEDARAERDAGDKRRGAQLFAIRDCIDAIAGVKEELNAADADIDALDIEQGATRAHAALCNIEHALSKVVYTFTPSPAP